MEGRERGEREREGNVVESKKFVTIDPGISDETTKATKTWFSLKSSEMSTSSVVYYLTGKFERVPSIRGSN